MKTKHISLLTVCSRHKSKLLANKKVHLALKSCWSRSSNWQVGRYLILPDHVNLFVTPGLNPIHIPLWIEGWQEESCKIIGQNSLWQPGFWHKPVSELEGYDFIWQSLNEDLGGWKFKGEIKKFQKRQISRVGSVGAEPSPVMIEVLWGRALL